MTTARSLVEQWDDGTVRSISASHDSRRGGHRSGTTVPSLVQHRAVESTWGGAPHFAVDFSPDWVAPEAPSL